MHTEENEIGYLAAPTRPGPRPGVVMIPDVWGLSDHTRDMARRLADEGFAVLALDVYRKTGKGEFAEPDEAMAWIAGLSDPLVIETIQEAVDFLRAHETVDGAAVGITGFCMGGQYALLAACACRDVAACAPFYGMIRYADGLDAAKKPRQPLDAIGDLGCPVLGFYGEADALIPVSDVEALRERLDASPHAAEIVLYADAGHAFMNDARPAMYREGPAKAAWARLVPFLHDRLG